MIYQSPGANSPAFCKAALWTAAGAAAAAGWAAPGHAAGTPAGTNVTNVATATYDLPSGGETSVQSNEVVLKVDELLDVTVASGETADVATTAGALAQVHKFTIANGGNGVESFALASVANGGGDDFDPVVSAIVLDSNGNGAYDAGVDTVYVAGANDPELDPDESATVFILSAIPAAAGDGHRGRIQLTAAAKTGTGVPGTSFAGQGQGGGDAVVGSTGADSDADGWYRVSKATVSFVKSATVSDPFGGTTKSPGATITYTLEATVSGSGSVVNLRVADPIPTGTTYKPGSITLDGTALTDAADADSGRFASGAVSVALGNIAAGTTKTIRFQVKID
jgi:uncharacterized repeat protein (TIGR01451 family)